ncbi:aromatic compound dioxygenase [Exidia glandulosa HHB12029]|uniref:Aromatic compound dioxygenase n=1 Tax=Exidia glandulosa HHB12029 TaxID=1314781 RepID=A0A165IU41_EXIGL|nr:aromatic compound dioxygenase [Exidia glandulosa HHB12029]
MSKINEHKTFDDLPLPDTDAIVSSNARIVNRDCPDPRLKFLTDTLVRHLHDYVRETNLTTAEWMSTIQFLTQTGHMCTDIRQEFILLSDVLGVSALVDALNHPKVGDSTESTVLGPFFTEDAPEVSIGGAIASEGKGSPMYVHGRVLDTSGKPIPGATIETWETDDTGHYDTQYENRGEPDCRGRLKSADDGTYAFRGVVPVAYPIPGDGPVGKLIGKLGRHNMRPAHLHLMVTAEGFEPLITSFYPSGDQYITSDAVFGVKKSLVVDLKTVKSAEEARAKGFPPSFGDEFALLERDIVLASVQESKAAREKLQKTEAAEKARQVSNI